MTLIIEEMGPEIRAYSADDRKRMAANGQAMPDGSYPIANKADLQNAIHAVGRGGGSHDAIRKHIMRRAKALGAMDMIPSNWMSDGSMKSSNSRTELLAGTRERRAMSLLEVDEADDGLVEFRGYASVFDAPYEVEDRFGKFTEVVDRRAFERTLKSGPDVMLNVDHAGLPLARTKSGTLQLSTDDHGLLVRARLEPSDPDVQRILPKMRRGDMGEMSFSFRAVRDEWNQSNTERRLNEVSIDDGDVCITPKGFNPATEAHVRSAVAALTDFDSMLLEARSADSGVTLEELRAARANLDGLIRELSPRKTFSVVQAERLAQL